MSGVSFGMKNDILTSPRILELTKRDEQLSDLIWNAPSFPTDGGAQRDAWRTEQDTVRREIETIIIEAQ
tara:strand:+ start:18754 stop:18960 length:207 start_codon:yes stop_codon:yes gene_type:complete